MTANIFSYDFDRVLSPQNFPCTLEEGQDLVNRTHSALKAGIRALVGTPKEKRTFDNTVMAYHDLMTQFDAVERLIRSERLIHDKTPNKAELIELCMRIKDATFADQDLLGAFLDYADRMNQESLLSPVEWTCLNGILHSIKENGFPQEFAATLNRVRQAIEQRGGMPYTYLQGSCGSKALTGETREISFLTANLCVMPEANSMIYGGLLPWPVRIDAIAVRLKELDPDVMFLQEVYDVRALSALQVRLGSSYSHFYGNVPSRLQGFSHESLFSSSGLAVISKFKLENVRFEPYTSMTHEDKPSGFDRLRVFGFDRNYGVFHCDAMNGKETLAHFATTHENPFYADIREKQTKQIVESFEKEAESHPEIPAILCGDLNIEQHDLNEGGERLLRQHFADHYNKEDGPTWYDFGNYWCKAWHPENASEFLNPNPMPWTVDRSLVWAPWAKSHPSYTSQVERVRLHEEKPHVALTDHHGILTRLKY